MFTAFTGGSDGPWKVTSLKCVRGEALPGVASVMISHTPQMPLPVPHWQLIGVAGHVRYVERPEKIQLTARQAGLGRPEATCAALIPIAKSTAWWELTQEERREIFEVRSHHIADSLKYLPAIARQLYHCRDLGQPFDFLTWFEFAPADAPSFEELVERLRRTEEWTYVEREIDLRLSR